MVLRRYFFRDILPIAVGGNGRQKALALLGDKLLDLKLYEKMMSSGISDVGAMTQQRSKLVSNANLSQCITQFISKDIITEEILIALSQKEKGSLLEAYIGAVYQQEGFTITPTVEQLVLHVLDELKRNTESSSTNGSEWKKAKTLLNEYLQKVGINDLYISVTSHGTLENQPPFIATFLCPPHVLQAAGLANPGEVISDECNTKKDAEEQVAQRSLEFFMKHCDKSVFRQNSE